MEDTALINLIQQMSGEVGQLSTTLDLKFKETEKTLSKLDSTLSKVDEKLDQNTTLTAQHESKIRSLEARVKKLEENQKWVIVTVLGAVILGVLAKVYGI